MATAWQNVLRRIGGAFGVLYNTSGKIYNSPNTLYNGVAAETTWTFINKSS